MKRLKFRNKLIVMALFMVVFVSIVSTIAAFFLINKQNREGSNDLLKKSFNIIFDDLSLIREKLVGDSRQMATIHDMPSKIKYITEYNKKVKEEVVGSTYGEVVKSIYDVGMMGDVRKMAFYSYEGDILAFATIRKEEAFLGYAHRFPDLAYKVAFLKNGEKLDSGSWKKVDKLPDNVKARFEKRIPTQEKLVFEEEESFICLVSYVPIIGKVYNKQTEKLEEKQLGFLRVNRKLGESFLRRLSSLTGMEINIFTRNGLSVGNINGYRTVKMGDIKQSKENWDLEKKEILLNDLTIKDNSYFQGVLPLYGDSGYVGSIAALYSKSISRANTWAMIKLLVLVSLGCIVMIIPLTFIFSNKLTGSIDRIINILSKNSDKVSSASRQISTASQSMAEGASEQASSLEETSSSLEEMASMTRQNADNAVQLDTIMKAANETVKRANVSIEEINRSMKEISKASEETQKIVKNIDEIAFQTNLLALNAAVEAARAGEAGAGFAVVADEVRNLAMRAADAAKNTSELIEDTVTRIKDGSNLVTATNETFTEVAKGASKVGKFVGQIAAASNEQAQGIEQVNKAVAEMDKVTQQNASIAEESAGASEEMRLQAEQMKDVIAELMILVSGGKNILGSGGHEKKLPVVAHKNVVSKKG